jgi:hypothetical protein
MLVQSKAASPTTAVPALAHWYSTDACDDQTPDEYPITAPTNPAITATASRLMCGAGNSNGAS